jgi:glycosyltransferase involved in cell wall biosynthesis
MGEALISVIVPVLNDPAGVRATAESLIAQNRSAGPFEVVLVDNGSSDATPEVIEELRQRCPDVVRSAYEHALRTSYGARCEGLRHARGELLCFVDANMTVPTDYIQRVREFFARSTADYIGCRVVLQEGPDTPAARYNRVLGFNVRKYVQRRHFAPTCCLSVRREVFDRVGAFDPRLESGGDKEFGQRVHLAGISQAYADDIVVFHPARWKYSSLLSKQRRIARGTAQLQLYYPDRYGKTARQYAAPWFYLPNEPLGFRRQAKQRDVLLSPMDWMLLPFLRVPLRIVAAVEYFRERRRLAAELPEASAHIKGVPAS